MRAPSAWNFFGFSRNSLISWSSSTASSTPATSLNVIFGESGVIRFARDLPKLITFDPPPCTWFMRKIQKPNRSTNGSRLVRIDHHADALGVELDVLVLELALKIRLGLVARVIDVELRPVEQRHVDLLLVRVEDDALVAPRVVLDARVEVREALALRLR